MAIGAEILASREEAENEENSNCKSKWQTKAAIDAGYECSYIGSDRAVIRKADKDNYSPQKESRSVSKTAAHKC